MATAVRVIRVTRVASVKWHTSSADYKPFVSPRESGVPSVQAVY
jgi:hypothetical protein